MPYLDKWLWYDSDDCENENEFLCIKDLAEYYSKTNPKGAYAKISRFLAKHNFSHKHEIITFAEYGGVFAE